MTVNCVCPGYIATDLTAGLKADAGFDAVVQERNPFGPVRVRVRSLTLTITLARSVTPWAG